MNREQAILAEIQRLMDEQFRALQGKLSGSGSREYLKRSNTIKALFEELNWDGGHAPRSLPAEIDINQPNVWANNGKNPHDIS